MHSHDILYIATDDFNNSLFQYCDNTSTYTLLQKQTTHPTNFPFCQVVSITGVEDSIEILNRILAVFDKYNSWDKQLNDMVKNEQPLIKLLSLSVPIFQNAIYIVDSSFKVLALTDIPEMSEMSYAWKFLSTYGYLPAYMVLDMEKNNELKKLSMHDNAILFHSKSFYNNFISINLNINGKFQGRMFVVELMNKFKDFYPELVEHLAEVVVASMRQLISFQPSQGEFFEHFLFDILSGRLTTLTTIQEKLTYWNWNRTGHYSLLLIPADNNDQIFLESCQNELNTLGDGHSTFYENRIVAIFNHNNDEEFQQYVKCLHSMLKNLKKKGCISTIFTKFEKLKPCYEQLKTVCEFYTWKENEYLAEAKNYSRLLTLYNYKDEEKLQLLCNNSICEMKDFDIQHKTNYLQTLACYLEHERSIKQTAATLHIHRNTLISRIKKINELWKLNLDDSSSRLWILFSITILQYFQVD
jgi:sugar diacid utilization regulator